MITPEGCIAEVIERLATFIIGYRLNPGCHQKRSQSGVSQVVEHFWVKIVAKYRSAPTVFRSSLVPRLKMDPDTR